MKIFKIISLKTNNNNNNNNKSHTKMTRSVGGV